MLRPIALLLASALLPSVAVASSLPPDWLRFSSPEGGYEVLMPREPSREQTSRLSPLGRIVTYIDIARLEDRLFVVNHTKLPRMALWLGVETYVFENTRERLIRENGGRERSYGDHQRGGRRGKLLLFDSPPVDDRPAWSWRAEIYVVAGRLYVFLANVPAGTPHLELEPFFESLTFRPLAER